MTGRRIAYLVAPNGVGHLRRGAGILDRLLDADPSWRVDLVCAQWQLDQLDGWGPLERVLGHAATAALTGVLDPGVGWERDPARYTVERLEGWRGRLDSLPAVHDAHLVVSDNLAGVLEIRPDAVLAGSFLWSDVLVGAHPDNPLIDAFVRRERELLDTHRPPMLCVRDVAMPGVWARTDAVGVGWMCPSRQPGPIVAPAAGGRPAVAFLGGRTGAADSLLAAAADHLAHAGELAVVDAHGFGFEAADYAGLAVCVARPGIGTLTDCVTHFLPIVAVREAGNPELDHNAARVVELGIGVDPGACPGPAAVESAVHEALERRVEIREQLAALDRDGLDDAARWLQDRGR